MAEYGDCWGVVEQCSSLDLDCHSDSLLTLSLNWFMTEKYEIIKNYVSRLRRTWCSFIAFSATASAIYLLGHNIFLLVCFKARTLWTEGSLGVSPVLFAFHHVHRVYLISVSLFCWFNVAFPRLGLCFGFRRGTAAHRQLTWNFSTSSTLCARRKQCWDIGLLNAYASTHLHRDRR